jgi:hypothetical protein
MNIPSATILRPNDMSPLATAVPSIIMPTMITTTTAAATTSVGLKAVTTTKAVMTGANITARHISRFLEGVLVGHRFIWIITSVP